MDGFVKLIIGVALFVLFLAYFSLEAVNDFNDEIIAGILGITTEQIDTHHKQTDKKLYHEEHYITEYRGNQDGIFDRELAKKEALLRFFLFLSYILIIYLLWKVLFKKKKSY